MNKKPPSSRKRFATAAILLGGASVVGIAGYSAHNNLNRPGGIPFYSNGQRYYVQEGSKRAVYPDRQACMADVPKERQNECEPTSSYTSSHRTGSWFGPVYSSGDTNYRPNSAYPTESASSTNMGKSVPSGASTSGFGANGKAFSDGGGS